MPLVVAPSFPLGAAEYARALRTGHGRAQLQVLRHGIGEDSRRLVDACLERLAFDPQTHGPRGEWLVDMVDRTGIVNDVVDAIAAAPATDFWDADHQCSVLEAIARRELHPRARPLLLGMLSRVPGSSDVVGLEQVVTLDGIDGMLFVARKLGHWLGEDASFHADDHPIRLLADGLGEEAVVSALVAASQTDADIARYARTVFDNPAPASAYLAIPTQLTTMSSSEVAERQSARRDRIRAIPASEVIATAREEDSGPCHWFTSWGWFGEDGSREEVFAALLDERSPVVAARLLRVFVRVGLPRFHPSLQRWAASTGEVAWAAMKGLSKVSDPRVRAMAIARLSGPEPDPCAIQLLQGNFAHGDHKFVERALLSDEDEDRWHDTLGDVLEVFEAHQVPESRTSLTTVYEHSPCELCRARAAELLDRLGLLPAWIAEEALFDANDELHALAKGSR